MKRYFIIYFTTSNTVISVPQKHIDQHIAAMVKRKHEQNQAGKKKQKVREDIVLKSTISSEEVPKKQVWGVGFDMCNNIEEIWNGILGLPGVRPLWSLFHLINDNYFDLPPVNSDQTNWAFILSNKAPIMYG